MSYASPLQFLLNESGPWDTQSETNLFQLASNVPAPTNPAPPPSDYAPCSCAPLDIACNLKCAGIKGIPQLPSVPFTPGTAGAPFAAGCAPYDIVCNLRNANAFENLGWFFGGAILLAAGIFAVVKA